MAASTTAASTALMTTLTGMFTVEGNGVALGRGLVDVMVNYLVETLLVRDASEVDIDDARTIADRHCECVSPPLRLARTICEAVYLTVCVGLR